MSGSFYCARFRRISAAAKVVPTPPKAIKPNESAVVVTICFFFIF
ncbi:hypothetical protein BCA_A0125 (plasmid) [Bacillus cereus 03BB102]|uniref:Uncharacterized protein n=1 Tax=Bacillus cereus (strain 03BB102) TaxID=572264 RepID=A0A125YA58_BACC3|nr:hypothetical protein BCA_A0125 [Bacillus cereus 03BB102]